MWWGRLERTLILFPVSLVVYQIKGGLSSVVIVYLGKLSLFAVTHLLVYIDYFKSLFQLWKGSS